MNDTTVFIYFICFAAVAGGTFAFMWRSMGFVFSRMEKYVDRPSRKGVHPEMSEVENGTELLVFRSEDDDDEEDTLIVRK